MANIRKVQTVWTGFPGAPGYTTFYSFEASGDLTPAYRAFFNAIAGLIPSNTDLQVGSSGNVLDDATGLIVDSWTSTPTAVVNGTGSGAYSAASGGYLLLGTDAVVNGRRVKGRAFLVPLYAGAYDTDGSILASALVTIRAAAVTLQTATAGGLIVWHRPVAMAGGSSHAVTVIECPDKVGVLRSRRD